MGLLTVCEREIGAVGKGERGKRRGEREGRGGGRGERSKWVRGVEEERVSK